MGSQFQGTYIHDCCGSNNTGYHDECSAGEEGHEGKLSLHVDVDGPKEGQWD